MLISSVLAAYCTIRPLRENSRYQLDRTCRLYGEHLGRPATCADLTDLAVSKWLLWLEDSGYAGESVFGHRARLLGLWAFAAKRGWAEPPGEVRKVSRPEPMPEAWTLDQVRKLLGATDQIRDVVRGVPIDRYLACLVETAYISGLRRSDLWGLSRRLILPDGTLRIRQSKTQGSIFPKIPCGLAARILSLPGEFPLSWPGNPRTFYDYWGRLIKAAGISKGALQKLRRTGATLVADEHDETAASDFLGHKTRSMVRWYVDRSIAAPRRYTPPKLDTGTDP